MQQVAAHDMGLDPLGQGLQRQHGPPAPIDQRGIGNVGAHARKDFVQTIKRQVIVELGDQHIGQKASPGHGARDRTAGRGQLHHLFAAAAGFLEAGDLDYLHLRRDHVQNLAGVLAYKTKVATAVRTVIAGIEFPPLALGRVGNARTASGLWHIRAVDGGCRRVFFGGNLINWLGFAFCDRNQQILQSKFQLLDLALDLLRGFAEGLLPELGDPQPQGLDQLVMGAQRRRHSGVSACRAKIIALRRAGSWGSFSTSLDMLLITT